MNTLRHCRAMEADRNKNLRDAASASKVEDTEPQRVALHQLLGKSRELVIEHGGADYRLRLTRANKLLLTK